MMLSEEIPGIIPPGFHSPHLLASFSHAHFPPRHTRTSPHGPLLPRAASHDIIA